MPLFDNTQLALQRAISGAAMRQEVLANNLANAETPGFRRSDVDFHSTLAQAMKSGDAEAIEGTTFAAQQESQVMRADGNGVDIDVENATMASNALEYETLVAVARGRTDVLRSAMGVA